MNGRVPGLLVLARHRPYDGVLQGRV